MSVSRWRRAAWERGRRKNMYPTPKMTTRKRSEYAELPLVVVVFELDDAARSGQGGVEAEGGEWNGGLRL